MDREHTKTVRAQHRDMKGTCQNRETSAEGYGEKTQKQGEFSKEQREITEIGRV